MIPIDLAPHEFGARRRMARIIVTVELDLIDAECSERVAFLETLQQGQK